TTARAVASLPDLGPWRDVLIGAQQDHVARLTICPEDEHLGDEGADLLRREIHHPDDAPSNQILRGVVVGDPGARALAPERAEIDPQLDGRPDGFGKLLRVDDDADAHVHAREIVPGDGHRGSGALLTELAEHGARIVVTDDLFGAIAQLRHRLRAPLI